MPILYFQIMSFNCREYFQMIFVGYGVVTMSKRVSKQILRRLKQKKKSSGDFIEIIKLNQKPTQTIC